MAVLDDLEVRHGRGHCFGNTGWRWYSPAQGCIEEIEPGRHRRGATDADRAAHTASLRIERDLGCGCNIGKVALASADLVKADANALLLPDRKVRLDKAAARRQRRRHRSDEEI